MKKVLFAVLEWYALKSRKWLWLPVMLLAVNGVASPYFEVPYVTKNSKLYLSQGVLLTPQFDYSQTFTNAAVVYHPLTAGSIIPTELQTYLPPESWSINFGGGYATKGAVLGPGISVNLLDSVRAWGSSILMLSTNPSMIAAAKQIAPGNGPLNIAFGPQWGLRVIQDGTFLPFNQIRLRPYWFVGASYGF